MVSLRMRVLDKQRESTGQSVLKDGVCEFLWNDCFETSNFQRKVADLSLRGLAAVVEPYRSLCIDDCVASIISAHCQQQPPGSAAAVDLLELGVGFDFRLHRLLSRGADSVAPVSLHSCDRLAVHSLEWDTEECIDIRRQLIRRLEQREERRRGRSSSSADCAEQHGDSAPLATLRGLAEVSVTRRLLCAPLSQQLERRRTMHSVRQGGADGPLVVVAEALFMHLSPSVVEGIVRDLHGIFSADSERAVRREVFLVCDGFAQSSVRRVVTEELGGVLQDDVDLLEIGEVRRAMGLWNKVFVLPFAVDRYRVHCFKLA